MKKAAKRAAKKPPVTQDKELSALSAVLHALLPLDEEARSRVLNYADAWSDARAPKGQF